MSYSVLGKYYFLTTSGNVNDTIPTQPLVTAKGNIIVPAIQFINQSDALNVPAWGFGNCTLDSFDIIWQGPTPPPAGLQMIVHWIMFTGN
jgi:hypothetical protein